MTKPVHSIQASPENLNQTGHTGTHTRNWLSAGVSVVMLCVALWFLHHELKDLPPEAILGHIRSMPLSRLILAVVFAACSYLVLTGYDAVGMQYIGRKLTYRQTAQTAFMAFAIGNNVGVAALSGGSIRYRMYSLLGLSGFEIAKIILFISVTFALGVSLLLGIAMLLMPSAGTEVLKLSPLALNAAGVILIALPVSYIVAATFAHAPIAFGRWTLSLPSPAIGLKQIGLSLADLMFAAACLYVLLAPTLHIGFFTFIGIFLIAIAAGLLSSVPGGIGVFEAVLLIALPGVDRTILLGTVIVYRLIYYVAPLFLALLWLVGHEVKQHRKMLGSSSRKAGEWLSAVAPQLIGLTVFLAGVVLLISGSTPAVESRLNFIAKGIPLPVLEISHLAGSIVGVGLLVLARGLFHRLQGAYLAAMVLLGIGIAASLLKGLDFEEALTLLAILGFLWFSRDEFYRRGSVADQAFTPGWVASILVVLCIVFWVGLISFRHVVYTNELWWQFALHSDAPRMLRASLVTGVAAMIFALWKLLRTGHHEPIPEVGRSDLEQVQAIVQQANQTTANAALMADKKFLWSPDRLAFIMYQKSGHSWVALGDPVGPVSAQEDLAWSFRELADRHDVHPVFYAVSDESLSMYVDMGLTLAKLGEDARVPLEMFSLQGSKYAEFRQALNKARKQGASFEIIPAAQVTAIVPELRAVSESWLSDRSTSEKGFSLGSFSEQYICRFDCAVVRLGADIVAFANLWPAPAAAELSIDLMRYNQHAPNGVMDYLFTELMLWAKANGYTWFSLGMAPLSGMEQHELAPLWHKLGHQIYSHGEAFYHFEGLRHYKEKFHPQWRPRYIACQGGLLGLPRALLDTSRLISGGFTKILKK